MNERWHNAVNASREPAPLNAVWNVAFAAVFGACVLALNASPSPPQDTDARHMKSVADRPACDIALAANSGLNREDSATVYPPACYTVAASTFPNAVTTGSKP